MKSLIRVVVVLVIVQVVSLAVEDSSPNAFQLRTHREPNFRFCFLVLNSNQEARFHDAIDSWQQRSTVSPDHVSCNASNRLPVERVDIDTLGNVYARVTSDAFGNSNRIQFDNNETWYNGTGDNPCDALDFWGIAAHEIGHVLGAAHPDVPESPQGERATMATNETGYVCNDTTLPKRSLTSDDEAFARYVSTNQYIPSTSFERLTDCISFCVDAFFWSEIDSADHVDFPAGAYHGCCYEKFENVGKIEQRVRLNTNTGGTGHDFDLRARNKGNQSTSIRMIVRDVTNGSVRLNETCWIPPNDQWELCDLRWYPLAFSDLTLYSFEVEKNNANPTVWVDSVRGEGALASATT